MKLLRALVFAPIVLAACSPMSPVDEGLNLAADDPRQIELTFQECAIYFAARDALQAQGRTASSGLTRGCPANASEAAVDITPMVSPPPMMSGFPTALDARIRARGVPDDLADDVVRSKAFWDLVARRDSILAGL
ncbi:hypothetical protein [Yoonia litorea]|uniref:Lipoprotein n=1 Tax=Yoonia litorea TaxID=1123755 RepID=A0A1I6M652_9RHOB|nr:hypothetical protein [Yoonia litorea]SFS11184.1 hypothetical protein SAMN05444714_1288 [Yoonia litorea]